MKDMRLIDPAALYERTAEWEAKALEQVERYMGWETMDDPDYKQWQHWTAVLNERSAFKFDVADAPTVDAVPVVRCKDCKYFEIEQLKRDGTDDKRYKPGVCVIGRYAKPRKADWFCADGERRQDETD